MARRRLQYDLQSLGLNFSNGDVVVKVGDNTDSAGLIAPLVIIWTNGISDGDDSFTYAPGSLAIDATNGSLFVTDATALASRKWQECKNA